MGRHRGGHTVTHVGCALLPASRGGDAGKAVATAGEYSLSASFCACLCVRHGESRRSGDADVDVDEEEMQVCATCQLA